MTLGSFAPIIDLLSQSSSLQNATTYASTPVYNILPKMLELSATDETDDFRMQNKNSSVDNYVPYTNALLQVNRTELG